MTFRRLQDNNVGQSSPGTGSSEELISTLANLIQNYQIPQDDQQFNFSQMLRGTADPAAREGLKIGQGIASLKGFDEDLLTSRGFNADKFNRQVRGLGIGQIAGSGLGLGLEMAASNLEGQVQRRNILDSRKAAQEAYERSVTQPDMGRPAQPFMQESFIAQQGGYMDYFKKGGTKKKKNKPNNPALWSRAIAAAKKKFDVYPSAYANAWAVQWYKKKGGTWRKGQDGGEGEPAQINFKEAAQKASNKTAPTNIEAILSGRHTTGIANPDTSPTEVNAELEKNEFIESPTGDPITKVVGKSHAQGGEMMNLEEGTRILSDNIKIGAENKKALEEIFEMKLRATDTVAQVLDKYRKSNESGLEDLMKEQEKAFKGLKENMKVEDEPTRLINEQFFADKVIEAEEQLSVARQKEKQVFDLLFRIQENLKERDEAGDPTVGNIRKRPKLEQEYVVDEKADIPEAPEVEVEEPNMEEVGVYMENGGYIPVFLQDGEVMVEETIMDAMRRDAMERGYADMSSYITDEATGMMSAQDGGVPDRYKKKGFRKVGVKKRAPSGAKHKWEVLARKKVNGKYRYKIVKGGFRGMKDFSQHKSKDRQKSFWSRMGGKSSPKTKDPFSPLYWHKRFGTWEEGGTFKPHMMYDPRTGQAVFAEIEQDHLDLSSQGFVHDPKEIKVADMGGSVIMYQDAVEEPTGYSAQNIVVSEGKEYIIDANGQALPVLVREDGTKYVQESTDPYSYAATSDLGAFQPAKYGREDILPDAKADITKKFSSFIDELERRNAVGEPITGDLNITGFSSPEPVAPSLWKQLGNAKSNEEANEFLARERAKTERGIFEEMAKARGIDISGLNINEIPVAMRGEVGDLEGYADFDPSLAGDGYLAQRGFGFDYTASQDQLKETPITPFEEEEEEIETEIPEFKSSARQFQAPIIDYLQPLPRPITGLMIPGLKVLPYRELPDVKQSEEAALVANAETLGQSIDIATQNVGAQTNAALTSLLRNTQAANNQAVAQTNAANAQSKQRTDIAEINAKSQIDQLNSAALYQYDVNAITAADNEIQNIMDYENARIEREAKFNADLRNQELAMVFGPNISRGPFGGLQLNPDSYTDLLQFNPNNPASSFLQSAYYGAGQEDTA